MVVAGCYRGDPPFSLGFQGRVKDFVCVCRGVWGVVVFKAAGVRRVLAEYLQVHVCGLWLVGHLCVFSSLQ